MGQPLIWPLQKVVSNHHTDFFLLPNSLCKTTIKTLKYKNHKKFIKNESSLNLIKSYEVVWYEQQKTKTSVLIPLSQLAGAGNFCFKSLPPFLLTACILSFQARSLQILLYALFHNFIGQYFFLFPVISSSITLCIWELMFGQMTWPCHGRQFWIIISSIYSTTPNLSWRISVNTLSNSLTSPIILII